MSENNSGVQQPDNRNNDQGRDKRQRFDSSKQDSRRNNNRNSNHRRRNNGQRQGGYDNKRGDNAEIQSEGNKVNKVQGRQGREQNREQNNKFKRDNQGGGEKRKHFDQERKPKNKRPREIDPEVAKTVKKVETIDDIRSDNARITKEIYLEIASLKNINLN
ncbi:MAG: hypothetical protein K6E12_01770 [Saccharofermentans sp.]|nr:hypothetical protein [Saccharofermentans sp.]